MKKFVSMVLTLAMVALLAAPTCTTALAATPRAQELADMLYAAKLFRGYGKDAAGNPIFGLDDTATRAESLVMLIRMLGKEAEAQNTSYTTPLTDIPDWCKGEIGYGYTSGLTSGTSKTTFSPTKTVTNTEFLVFALRALGYTSGADYEWAKAAVKAAELGVIESGEYADRTAAFTRGDMVIVAHGALTTKVKGSNKTLAETLGLDLKPVEKPVPKPGAGTGIPAVDKVVGTVDIYAPEFVGWLPLTDGNGKFLANYIDIQDLPDGTIIKDIGEGRDTSKTFEESLEVFLANLYKIDCSVKYYDNSGFGSSVWNTDALLYKDDVDNVVVIGSHFFKDDSFNRILVLNSMSYFGDKGMASKVYAMMSDHYANRKDNDKIITPEFAAKYGLTIKHDYSYMTVLKDCGGTVSDGTLTWKIGYNTKNLESRDGQSVTFCVEIPT